MTQDQNASHQPNLTAAEDSSKKRDFSKAQNQTTAATSPHSYPGGQPGQPVYPPPGYHYSGGSHLGGSPPVGPPPRYTGGDPGPRRFPIWKVLFGIIAVTAVLLFIFMLIPVILGKGTNASTITFGSRIGLVHIEGVLLPGIQHEFQMKALDDLADNDRVRGIVLYIDSPGGSVGTSQELFERVRQIREKRGIPIYTAMGNTAASGGYYIAAASDKIYALKGTLTGSIGVIFSKPEFGELARRVGVDTETITSGRFKDAGAYTRKMNEDERYIFEYMINDTHQQFLDDILMNREKPMEAASRNLPHEKWAEYLFEKPDVISAKSFLEQVADGRAYTGRQALELGLIDQIGALDNAIRDLAENVGITGDPNVIQIKHKPTFRELLGTKMETVLPDNHSMLKYIMPSY